MIRHLTVASLSLAAALVTASAAAGDAKPKAVPVEPIVDVGIVARGEPIVHDFEIRNEGQATLELTDVSPSCGCTVAEYDPRIEPGKTGKVRTKLDTSDFPGAISKSVAVFTNDPENPKLQLVIKAEVKPYLRVTPGYARFIYVQGEPIGVIEQAIWAEDGYDISILDVKKDSKFVKVTQREATAAERDEKATGREFIVGVTIDPDSPVGVLRQYVELKVDHPKQKVVKIPVTGFVRPRQHVTPQQVDFGKLEASSLPLQRTLDFTNFITAGIEVTGIETGVEGLEAEARSTEDSGHRFKLRLTLSPELPKGDFSGTMKIHITDKQNPIVEVPIRGTVL